MQDKPNTLESFLSAADKQSLTDMVMEFSGFYSEADKAFEDVIKDKNASYEKHVDRKAPKALGMFRPVHPDHYKFCEARQLEADEERAHVLFYLERIGKKLNQDGQDGLADVSEENLDTFFDQLTYCWVYDFHIDGLTPAAEEIFKIGSSIVTLKRINRVFDYWDTMDDDDQLALLKMLFKYNSKVQEELNPENIPDDKPRPSPEGDD